MLEVYFTRVLKFRNFTILMSGLFADHVF